MPFDITLIPAGRTFRVVDGETVLEAALRQGLTLPYGCRNGICGACKARLLSGSVDYPDGPPSALPADEADAFLPCLAVPRSDLTVRTAAGAAVAPLPRTLPCQVVRKERLAPEVMRLWLRLPEGRRLGHRAGQYIDIVLPDGRRRGFSLANPPEEDALLELHVRRRPGGFFTSQVFDGLSEGALLRIEGPLGDFHLREDGDRPWVFVAGGTGFAPIKAMVEHAIRRGLSRPIHLYRGARDRAALYLPDLPIAWREALPGLRYVPVLSHPAPEDRWQGRTGLVTEAVVADLSDLSGFDLYMAGPPAMVATGRALFPAHGLPSERLFYDSFEPATDGN